MSALEERYQVELNETAFSQAKTVADVEKLLQHPFVAAHAISFIPFGRSVAIAWLRVAIYYAFVWPATRFLLIRESWVEEFR